MLIALKKDGKVGKLKSIVIIGEISLDIKKLS